MSEKGLKMVGRGIDGTAKAVRTDNDGVLQVGLIEGALGKNLINPDKLFYGYIESTGTTTYDPSWRYTDYIPVVAGESLVLSNIANSAVAGVAFYTDSNAFVSWISINDIKTALGVMEVPVNATKVRVSNILTYYNKCQLERGTVATDFEPYKVNLHRQIEDLTKIVREIKDNDGVSQVELIEGVLGKNLIDYDTLFIGYIESTGTTTYDPSWRYTDYIPVVAGESWVVSNIANSAVAGVAFYNASNVLVSWISNTVINTELGGVINVPVNATKLRASNAYSFSINWQLERGTVATTFEPYKASLHRQIVDLTEIVREIKDNEHNQESPLQEISSDLEYTEMPYVVIASSNFSTYAVDNNKSLYRSSNGGDTWINTGWVFTNNVTTGLVLDRYNSVDAGELIVFAGTNVLKSTDAGTSFVTVLTNVSTPLTHGIYGNDNTIIFGEYTVTGSPTNTARLWKSTDRGDTWTVALTLTDVTHFHTVKYFGALGWYATTGDTEEGSRFYFSGDTGVTWKEVARGYEYRTVGLSRTSQDVILWASDHNKRGIFAAKHGFIKSTTRRINSITGMCLGIAGEDDVIITSTRTELDTQKGSFVNPVYLSTDGGATWNIDYFRESLGALNGTNGIVGPNGQGDFFLKYTWTKGLTTPNATIRARRKNTHKLLGSAVQNSTTKEFIKVVVVDKPLQLDIGESELVAFSSVLPYSHVVDASLYIKNTHSSTLTLSFMRAGSTVYKSNGDDINLVIPANKQIIIAVKELGLEFIDKDISIKIEPTQSLVGSTGNVTVELTGEHFVPTDVRRM